MSSRIPSLLLPLCLLSAVALNVYPLLDPTGVYGSYLSKLDKKTPPVAAVALAAADGVYPWSEQNGVRTAPRTRACSRAGAGARTRARRACLPLHHRGCKLL